MFFLIFPGIVYLRNFVVFTGNCVSLGILSCLGVGEATTELTGLIVSNIVYIAEPLVFVLLISVLEYQINDKVN